MRKILKQIIDECEACEVSSEGESIIYTLSLTDDKKAVIQINDPEFEEFEITHGKFTNYMYIDLPSDQELEFQQWLKLVSI